MGVLIELFAITEGTVCIKNTGIASIDLGRFTFDLPKIEKVTHAVGPTRETRPRFWG
jgi:hypothetical protein